MFRASSLVLIIGLACLFLITIESNHVLSTKGEASLNSGSSNSPRPELVLQTGHSKGVLCAAFAPNGAWLASGGADNAIKIWQVATGRELRALNGHNGSVKALAASPDGRWLASGSSDRTVKVWDVVTGREVYSLGRNSSVEALAFSPDSRWLVSASADRTVRIWDTSKGNEAGTLSDPDNQITVLAFSNNGNLLATGSTNSTIKLWDTHSWKALRSFRKPAGRITALVFSPDNNWIASATADGSASLSSTSSDRERPFMKRNASSALAVAFTPDDSLVVAHSDGGVDFWNLSSGKPSRIIPPDPNGEQLIYASFATDAETMASGDGGRTVNLHRLTLNGESKLLQSHSTGFNAIDVSRDGRWIASAANDSSIRLWQVATGRELSPLTGHMGYVTTLAFSPDSHLLASGSRSGEIKIWNPITGRLEFSLPSSSKGIDIVAFSGDGKVLAAAGMDQTIEIWNLAGKKIGSLRGHTGEVTSLVFSNDNQVLISAGRDETIRMWDLASGNVIRTLKLTSAEVNSLALSPDGKLLAAALSDKTITTWDSSTGLVLHSLSGHHNEVLKIVFSPDGQLLCSASSDHTAKIWDARSGEELRTFVGASGAVTGVAFSNDGQWLFSSSDDGTLMVWDAATATLAATLVAIPNSDEWFVATPDGLFDGSPAAWDLLLWRFAGETFEVMPVEAYFNEFFYPGVLARILVGLRPRAPHDITQKDRRPPRVSIAFNGDSQAQVETRTITVRLEVSEAEADRHHSTGSGARDLRLFRNGLLIKEWPGDVLHGSARDTAEVSIPLVAGENHLSAYAFNNDNIKSANASLGLIGAGNLKRIGAVYLLTIGVAEYENPEFNLQYPVADAAEMSAQLRAQQQAIGRYSPIIPISLKNSEATRANILLALRRLAGTNDGPLPADAPLALRTLSKAQPEDAIVIYFSGHGTSSQDRFYMIPHDLGYKGARSALDSAGWEMILAHSISDAELENALSPLDVDQLLLVLDACKSGQALKATEERWGPMNTRGLAQLAYEKGMYVLTASQSDEVAYESEKLKHSYLAWALVEDGIKSGLADRNGDGQILLPEWLAYASERVPQMRRQQLRSKDLIEEEADEQKVQRPRVFYTRESQTEKLIIARTSAGPARHN